MSVSTMGGNIAENSGGLRGLKYGTTKKYVMGLEVLTETGEIMKTGACGRGCEYGYNLTELLVASEGTLALTSKAVLKLVTPPKASKAMMAIFPEVKRASQAVAGIIAAHVVPCTLEFMDNATINYVEDYVNIGLPRDAAAILLIEVDGHPAQVADEAVSVEKVLKDNGAGSCGRQRMPRKDADLGSPPRGDPRSGPLPSHADAGRRHRAAFQDSRHARGARQDRRAPSCDHRYLRSRRGRQSAPVHPLRQARQGRILPRGAGR